MKTSGCIKFIERNDLLTADQIQFLRSHIGLNEILVRKISKFYVSSYVLYKIKEWHQALLKEYV